VNHKEHDEQQDGRGREAGFTLVETLIATGLLLIVSATVTSALMQMTKSQATIWNRTEMHSGVRSATELLQQEVGQAGRITLPQTTTFASAVAVAGRTVTLNSVNGVFVGELLTVDTGSLSGCTKCQETVEVRTVDTATRVITADNKLLLDLAPGTTPGFQYAHDAGVPVAVYGGFASGIVPTNYATNPSTGTVLKLYGDINSDGQMVYVEYTCDTSTDPGFLYRNVMNFDQAPPKPQVAAAQVLLSNIKPNPENTPCFTYQQQTVLGNTYVTDVAITLTVQTEQRDPITKNYQTETKALLNVSPRNVFNVWQLAGANLTDHVQPMPPTVTALLAPAP
jgi:type II secretory pathway pseudopilin PulG